MAKDALWRCATFDLSMAVWGYELVGDASETAAMTAETPEFVRWDRDAEYLRTIEVYVEGEKRPVPEHWALPWVGDARSKGLVDA